MQYTRRTILGSTATVLAISGCIGTDPDDSPMDDDNGPTEPQPTPTDEPQPTPTDDMASASVQVRSHSEYGDILAGPDGRTLYMFDSDTQGEASSTCSGGCAENWPPLTVEGEFEAGTDVTAELTTFERDDGSTQLAANGWPLYYFVNDDEPGDVEGQGVNEVWWVLRPDGTPVRSTDASDDTAASVRVREHPEHGDILVGPDEMTLYMFDSDTQGSLASTCTDGCAESWPPLVVEEEPTAGGDVTAELETFERDDGSVQVAANGWPLYYFAPDSEPGDAEGQGVNEVWWVLDPSGTPIKPNSNGSSSAY